MVWRERKPTRCNNQMFINNFCLNMFRASLCPSSREQRPCVTAYGVLRWFCWMWLVAVVGRCVVGCEHCKIIPPFAGPSLTLRMSNVYQSTRCHIPEELNVYRHPSDNNWSHAVAASFRHSRSQSTFRPFCKRGPIAGRQLHRQKNRHGVALKCREKFILMCSLIRRLLTGKCPSSD